jgi:inner membrane protein
MMSITHASIAAAGISLIFSTADPFVLSIAIVGSQLPDLDTSTSHIGQIFFPLSRWIEKRYPHRTITHCLWATVAIAVVSLPIGWYFGFLLQAAALPMGHLLSCFSDIFTKQGVQLFYPTPAWCISVSNPKRRLTTGGPGEYWVLCGAIAFLCLGIYLTGGGGLTQGLGQSLGLRDVAIEQYNKHAASHHLYAKVTGIWASDRSRADGRFYVLANDGQQFLVMDRRGVYKTGTQILPDKLTIDVGESATVQIQTLTFTDEAIAPKLQQFTAAYPNATIYLSGSITVDLPEDVVIPMNPTQYATATNNGGSVGMDNHPIEAAIIQLSEQWGTGTIAAKVISPRPQL